MNLSTKRRSLAILLGGCLSTLGILSAVVTQTAPGLSADSVMSTGITSTVTTPPAAPATPLATPGIKGPAPLPVEEQGLPG